MGLDNLPKTQNKRTNQKTAFQLIKELTGQLNVLTVPRAFIKYTGTLDAALFLSQVLYWSDKGRNGWFYKTYLDWDNEITLSKYQVRKATKTLKDKGILETKVQKANGNPTLHYRLDVDRFSESFMDFLGEPQVYHLTDEQEDKLQAKEDARRRLFQVPNSIYNDFNALRPDGAIFEGVQ